MSARRCPRLLGRLVLGFLASASPLAAQAGFDLVEINKLPGPDNPGVDYTFAPVSAYSAEATGTAVADINNDGYQDLMFFGTENQPNKLYINLGNGHFTESAAAFGVDEPTKRRGFGAFFDFDNDGDLDLITCGYPGFPTINLNLWSLYRNDGPPNYHFTSITASSGGFVLGPTTETTVLGDPGGIAVADYNRDGFLDVLTTYWNRNNVGTGYAKDQFRLWKNVPNPQPNLGQPDYTPRLLVDATKEAGLDGVGFGWIWMPSFVDFNRDGWPDLHLNVEAGLDELRLNLGNGTFGPNIATQVGMNYNASRDMGHEMGVALADYDLDGDVDAYLTNSADIPGTDDAFYRNDSQLATGGSGLGFLNIGPVITDAATTGLGWGAAFVDMDDDGDLDLLNARGLGNLPARNMVWLNLYPQKASDGVSIALQDVSSSFPDFNVLGLSRSLVAFDYDNDGDLDVVTTRSGNMPPQPGDNLHAAFYKNTLPATTHWLELDLVGANGSLNTVGARVDVRTGGVGGKDQMHEVICGDSFLNQSPSRQHFGLGAAASADWVAVRWLDGNVSVVRDSLAQPLQGIRTLARGTHVDTGDVNGDGAVNCADVATLNAGLIDPAAVDALVPDWPWRIVADLSGNGYVEKADFATLRALVPDPFCDIGAGLAGTHGVPTLAGAGTLQPLTSVSLSLSGTLENTGAFLVIGFSLADQKFKGGVLVPSADILLGPFPTGPAGSLFLPSVWPSGIPAGLQLEFQFWLPDGAGVHGFAASNGLSALAH